MRWTWLRGGVGPWAVGSCLLACWFSGVVAEAPRSQTDRLRDAALLRRGPIEEKTRKERYFLMGRFKDWLWEKVPEHSLEQLALEFPMRLSEWVEAYIVVLFEVKHSLRSASEVVNSLQMSFRRLKGQLTGPRGLLATWRGLEPTTSAPPLPELLLRALVATALS